LSGAERFFVCGLRVDGKQFLRKIFALWGLKESALGLRESNLSLREPTLGLRRATEAKKEGMLGLKESTSSLKEGKFPLRERMSSLKEGTSGQKESASSLKESKPTLKDPTGVVRERKMSAGNNNPQKITLSGVVFAILVIAILALIAVPRLREASRVEGPGKARALGRFDGSAVTDSAAVGVGVSCRSCDPVGPALR